MTANALFKCLRSEASHIPGSRLAALCSNDHDRASCLDPGRARDGERCGAHP